ncbi:MAG: hypothetical protein ACTSSG_13710, partial [Candidatus Heimdallarchaeaceae archaeon]
EDKFIAEVDRYAWGFTGFERILDGKKISIKSRLSSHQLLVGIKNSMKLFFYNGTGENITVKLDIKAFDGLKWENTFPTEIEIKNGETKEIERDFILDRTVSLFKSNQEAAAKIETKISFKDYSFQLSTGGKIRPAIKFSSSDKYKLIPYETPSEIFLDLQNFTNKKIKGKIEYYIENLKNSKKIMEFSLNVDEITGFKIPIKLPKDSEKTIFILHATPFIYRNNALLPMPEFKFPIIARTPDLLEVIHSPEENRVFVVSNVWAINVNLEGGTIFFSKYSVNDRKNRAAFELGPPFGMNLDRTLKYNFNIKRERDELTLTLEGNSLKTEDFCIKKYLKVKSNVKEVEHWIEVKNISSEKILSTGGKITTHSSRGLSTSTFWNHSRVFTPIDGKVIESDPTFPAISETLVSSNPEKWQESWTAAEIINESNFIAWIWKQENIEKISVYQGFLEFLESKTVKVNPGESKEIFHLWFGYSFSSLQEVRNRWNQLVGNLEFSSKEQLLSPLTVRPVEVNMKGENILVKGKSEIKILQITFLTSYPLPGLLTLSLPEDWSGSFITSEGKKDVLPMPNPDPLSPQEIKIEVSVPQQISRTSETIFLHFSGEFELEFPLSVLLITDNEVILIESEKAEDKTSKLDNGILSFCVPQEICGNLIRLKDSLGRTFLYDTFPDIKPKFFMEHYLGGMHPLIFHSSDETAFTYPEKISSSFVSDGAWKGIQASWIVKNSELLKNQNFSITYLTLPGSSLIRVIVKNKNQSSRKIQAIIFFVNDIALEGKTEGNTIQVPGGFGTWTRNRVQKPFENQTNIKEPWVRVYKNNQSLSFFLIPGKLGINTIFDAQMAIMNFIGTTLETQPFSESTFEFFVLINQPQNSINEILRALNKK